MRQDTLFYRQRKEKPREGRNELIKWRGFYNLVLNSLVTPVRVWLLTWYSLSNFLRLHANRAYTRIELLNRRKQTLNPAVILIQSEATHILGIIFYARKITKFWKFDIDFLAMVSPRQTTRSHNMCAVSYQWCKRETTEANSHINQSREFFIDHLNGRKLNGRKDRA